MTDIDWREPPPKAASRPRWREIAEQLAERPGSWAKFGPYADDGSMMRYLRRVYGLEVTSRQAGDGRRWLYARVPEP